MYLDIILNIVDLVGSYLLNKSVLFLCRKQKHGSFFLFISTFLAFIYVYLRLFGDRAGWIFSRESDPSLEFYFTVFNFCASSINAFVTNSKMV